MTEQQSRYARLLAREAVMEKQPRQEPVSPAEQPEDLRIPATPEALATAVLRGGAPRREPAPPKTE